MPTGRDSADRRGGDNDPVMDVRTTLERLREGSRRAVRGADAGLASGAPLRLARREWQFDTVVALVLGVVTVYYGVDNADNVVIREVAPGVERVVPRPSGPGGMAFMVTLAALASGALALRRRFPLAVLCVVTAATLATPQSVMRLTFYAFVIAVYSAAVYSPYRMATLVALPLSVVLIGTSGNSVTPIVPNEYIALLILVPMAVAAVGLRTWKLRTDEGRARLDTLRREQSEALRRAVEHERARIARELHDVVTHNVSVMIIQAGAARKIMHTSPEQAGEALLAVAAGGRAAMTELRHVMGLLTMADEDAGAEAGADTTGHGGGTGPAARPGPAGRAGLAGPGRRAARRPDRDRPAPPPAARPRTRRLPRGAGSPDEHREARVRRHRRRDRRVRPAAAAGGSHRHRWQSGAGSGSGRGLIGLRERLAVHGGTLTTGRRLTGGFRVEALIPLETP